MEIEDTKAKIICFLCVLCLCGEKRPERDRPEPGISKSLKTTGDNKVEIIYFLCVLCASVVNIP